MTKLFTTNLRGIVILVLSILIALFFINQSRYLRGLGYETIPDTHITDEYNYVWQAISLKKYGLPVAWSTFTNVYSNPKYQPQKGNLQGLGISVDGKIITLEEFKKNSKPVTAVSEVDWSKGLEHMYFVAPFFYHSPLGGLIYSLGVNKNISQFDQVKPSDFRKPALVMAIVTAVLLYIFIFQITGKPLVAVLSTAIYSTVPTYIFATRGAYLENVSSPFILGHLILLLISVNLLKNRRFNLVYPLIFLSGLLGGFGGLSKELSMGFLLGSLFIVLISKISVRYILTLIAGIALPIVIYIGWGLWLQKSLFIGVFLANSARADFGSLKFLTMLESLRFKDFPIDGWWVWGIISAFFVGYLTDLKKNKYVYLVLPMLFGFLAVIFSANSNYSWYWLSLIPFLAGASGIVIGYLFEYPNFILLMTFFLLPFSSSFYWGYSVFHKNSGQDLNLYRGAFIVLLAAFVIRKYLTRYKYARYIWMAVFFVILFEISKWNFRSIQYLVANWGNFPVPSLPNL
jgi:hypothetical protein